MSEQRYPFTIERQEIVANAAQLSVSEIVELARTADILPQDEREYDLNRITGRPKTFSNDDLIDLRGEPAFLAYERPNNRFKRFSWNGPCFCPSRNRPWLDWLRWRTHQVNYFFEVVERKERIFVLGGVEASEKTYFTIRRDSTDGGPRGLAVLCMCGRWLEALIDERGNPTTVQEGEMSYHRKFADARMAEQFVRRLRHSIPQAWEWWAGALLIGTQIVAAIIIRCT